MFISCKHSSKSKFLGGDSEKELEDHKLEVSFEKVMKSPFVIKQDDPLLIEVRKFIFKCILSLIH